MGHTWSHMAFHTASTQWSNSSVHLTSLYIRQWVHATYGCPIIILSPILSGIHTTSSFTLLMSTCSMTPRPFLTSSLRMNSYKVHICAKKDTNASSWCTNIGWSSECLGRLYQSTWLYGCNNTGLSHPLRVEQGVQGLEIWRVRVSDLMNRIWLQSQPSL